MECVTCPSRRPHCPGGSCRAKPVHAHNAQGAEVVSEDDDASSCTSSGASANDHIERADLLPIRQCGSLLTTLVSLFSFSKLANCHRQKALPTIDRSPAVIDVDPVLCS